MPLERINNNFTNFIETFAFPREVDKKSEASPPPKGINSNTNAVAKKILELPTKIINASKNYAIKKLDSSKKGVKEIFSQIKDIQTERANNKQIAVFQKDIDIKFKAIMELEKTPDPANKRRIENLERGIDLSAMAIKGINRSQVVFKQIAQGKAKMVFVEYEIKGDITLNHNFNSKNVYYAPVGGDFLTKFLRKKEISDELEIGLDISKILKKMPSPVEDEKYIVTDMDVMKNSESQKNGEYTVKTSKAKDLKHAIQEGTLKFPESLKIGLHIVKGMSNLHKAGYVHGDGKNDNVLLVQGKNGELTGRIADLGKTQKMKAGEKGIFVGNPRFAAPEGNLSHSGEIYTTAILIINTLEGELLKIDGKDMLIPTEKFVNDPKANTVGRFGIEKFLLLNKKCLQTDNSTFNKKVKILGKEIKNKLNSNIGKSNTTELHEAQAQTDMYIGALIKRLSAEYPKSEKQINELEDLLLEMTRAKVGDGDDTRTKSLEDIIPRYEEIIRNLTRTA
ncbi:MAG: protein kinase [Parachlamydiaceae bacterium]|nr:protein kinase [Parachlamydiaceae bacterium]